VSRIASVELLLERHASTASIRLMARLNKRGHFKPERPVSAGRTFKLLHPKPTMYFASKSSCTSEPGSCSGFGRLLRGVGRSRPRGPKA